MILGILVDFNFSITTQIVLVQGTFLLFPIKGLVGYKGRTQQRLAQLLRMYASQNSVLKNLLIY